MKHKAPGSILLVVMLFLAIISALLNKFTQNVLLGSRFVTRTIAQHKAQVLAINGLTLAFAQLTNQAVSLDEKLSPEEIKKQRLALLLEKLNQWQTYELTPEIDGMHGTINVLISCEEGKIPINTLFDASTSMPKKEAEPLLNALQEIGFPTKDQLIKQLSAAMKKNKNTLEDASQLLPLIPLKQWPDLAQSIPVSSPKKQEISIKQRLMLYDLFSVHNITEKINPLFASSSTQLLLGIKPPKKDTEKKDVFVTVAGNITAPKEWGTDWKKNWSIIAPLYGAEPPLLSTISTLLSEEIEPSMFCVLSYGTIDNVTMRLAALVHRQEESTPLEPTKNDAKEAKVDKKLPPYQTALSTDKWGIIRLYWIDHVDHI